MKPFEYRNFDYSGWKRPAHEIIKDAQLKSELYNKGYSVIPGFISDTEVAELKNSYTQNHTINVADGGLFVSIYSKNLDYRNQIHNKILETTGKKFETIFQNYKFTCLSYIVKYPGKKGELFVHQDMAQVDEFNHSQVGIWLPLQDVNLENGTMGILPYSHFTIPPHRTLYHQLPFSKIYPTAFKYLQPVKLKAGDLLLFDIRLLHNSFINTSNEPRIVIGSSAVAADAPFCICYRDKESKSETAENEYELIEVSDNFYLDFKDFKSEKILRPEGKTGKKILIKERFVEEDEFIDFCEKHKIEAHDNTSFINTEQTKSIQEPDYSEEPVLSSAIANKKTFFERFKQLF